MIAFIGNWLARFTTPSAEIRVPERRPDSVTAGVRRALADCEVSSGPLAREGLRIMAGLWWALGERRTPGIM